MLILKQQKAQKYKSWSIEIWKGQCTSAKPFLIYSTLDNFYYLSMITLSSMRWKLRLRSSDKYEISSQVLPTPSSSLWRKNLQPRPSLIIIIAVVWRYSGSGESAGDGAGNSLIVFCKLRLVKWEEKIIIHTWGSRRVVSSPILRRCGEKKPHPSASSLQRKRKQTQGSRHVVSSPVPHHRRHRGSMVLRRWWWCWYWQ